RNGSSRKQHVHSLKSFTAANKIRQRGENSLRFEFSRYDIYMNVRVTKSICCRFADCARLQFVQVFNLLSFRSEATQKEIDSVDAREDEPVVPIEVIDCFIKLVVTFRVTDFNCRTEHHLRAVPLQGCRKISGLISSTRDHHSLSGKRLVHIRERCSSRTVKEGSRCDPSPRLPVGLLP